ncbi:hypothetical protein TNCV_2070431 [Trichonephila clavipes]|uniref:Uncharacterized protein n=1 Tax=Trichonephila clavipes TaxID=2585209 RepID=A0A8X7BDG8_TRICX|nr:hypothetical protein TNCV_2070431 [Trichonephila clavipes]
MVIFKRKTVRKSNFPKGVFIHVHQKEWMDENDGTEDDYLFMEESNSDGENDTGFDDVPEDTTEDEYAYLFMLSNNRSS